MADPRLRKWAASSDRICVPFSGGALASGAFFPLTTSPWKWAENRVGVLLNGIAFHFGRYADSAVLQAARLASAHSSQGSAHVMHFARH